MPDAILHTTGSISFGQHRRWKIYKSNNVHHCNAITSNIIWLGDLSYRLVAGYNDTHKLLKKNNWQAQLEKDQLRIEQRVGRVFKGWNEVGIYFAPTYKYLANFDHYVAQTSKSKEKRWTLAWYDLRIPY